MNRLIIRSEIKSVIKKKSPCKQNSEPDGFLRELYQIYKEKLKPILLQLFQNTEQEGTLPNSLYEARITLISKLEKTNKKTAEQYP